jgi:hypothetical protein
VLDDKSVKGAIDVDIIMLLIRETSAASGSVAFDVEGQMICEW